MSLIQLERPTAELPLTTRDGATAWLSALAPGDRRTVGAVFDGLSDRSRYFRFLASTPRLSGSASRHLADVDQHRHVALVATVDGRVAGIGRYVRYVDDPRRADVAIAVVDHQQSRGVGSLLLAALGAVAAGTGVDAFTYLVHPSNDACVALLRPVAGRLTLEDGELAGSGPVPAHLLDPEASASLVRLVRAAGLLTTSPTH